MPLFQRLLIANRGEIARRVIRTAKRLGIETVAVYSDADASALHVLEADNAVRLGPATAAESYLRIEAVLAAATETGADAIHPGYGFLSENAAFADAVAGAGVQFVGPPAAAITAMGSKSKAKALMAEAGVPIVPGHHGEDATPERLLAAAKEMGFPVLLKAVAGGGGKGMRVVETADGFTDAYAAAAREAKAAFGDDRFLVEKYLARPRHVEVQVFSDRSGRAVHLFERDCSLQRRHQKIVEEAPAPGLSADLRARMGETACRAAQAIGYEGAGTVEFLLDADGSFYFMEMNTRLQVEHPVTEMVTGLDLVEWQLRIAAGEDVPLGQDQIFLNGHAVETRLYAEEPENGFLPSTGTLERFRWPGMGNETTENGHRLRLDSGVQEGDEVSLHYDPMIGKVIAWAPTRDEAIDALTGALSNAELDGVGTNRRFLMDVMETSEFRTAELHTGLVDAFIATWSPEPPELTDMLLILGAYAVWRTASPKRPQPCSPWDMDDGWRLNGPGGYRSAFHLETGRRTVTFRTGAEGRISAHVDEADAGIEIGEAEWAGDTLSLVIGGETVSAGVAAQSGRVALFISGATLTLETAAPKTQRVTGASGEVRAVAPMPGRIVTIPVTEGTKVASGDVVVVVEAMKMEHAVTADAPGVVASLHTEVGQQVARGDLLVSLSPPD